MAKYIYNSEILEKEELAAYDIGILLLISALPDKRIENNFKETLCSSSPNILDAYVHCGWATTIKSKKNIWESIRLTPKGEKMVASLFEKPISNLAEECFDLLKKYYKDYNLTSKIKNKKKTIFYINEWLNYKESYTLRQFEAVLMTYLESFEHHKLVYAKNTLTLFFNPESAYISKWHVSHCPFEDFIQTSDRNIIIENYRRLEY